MKISMTGLEKGDLLTQVTAWAGWTILTMHETFIIIEVLFSGVSSMFEGHLTSLGFCFRVCVLRLRDIKHHWGFVFGCEFYV
jgi:hypothetical protein